MAAVPGITQSSFANLKIPIPQINEQQEIVKKLNAFFNYQFKREQEITKTDFLLKNSIKALIN